MTNKLQKKPSIVIQIISMNVVSYTDLEAGFVIFFKIKQRKMPQNMKLSARFRTVFDSVYSFQINAIRIIEVKTNEISDYFGLQQKQTTVRTAKTMNSKLT